MALYKKLDLWSIDVITNTITELDYHQSAIKGKNDEITLHEAAWLA